MIDEGSNQMMFASITPLLMTGAFAERIRLLGFVPLIVIWEILVYYPGKTNAVFFLPRL